MNGKTMDDDDVLHTYYDDRFTFVVDIDPKLVKVEIEFDGTITFRYIGHPASLEGKK